MKITDVRIKKFDNSENKVKATASICFDDAFVVHDIRVIEKASGLAVVMPSRKVNDKFMDIAHPINTELRSEISKAVLDAYNK